MLMFIHHIWCYLMVSASNKKKRRFCITLIEMGLRGLRSLALEESQPQDTIVSYVIDSINTVNKKEKSGSYQKSFINALIKSYEYPKSISNIKSIKKSYMFIKNIINDNSKANNTLNQKQKSYGSVKSAIEGVVFINISSSKENSSIFIGEVINFYKKKKTKNNTFLKFNLKGMVLGLSLNTAEVMLFGDTSEIAPGDVWLGTTNIININCGPQYLGRVIDCIGNTLDGSQPLGQTYNIFAKVPGVCARERVGQSLFTGLLSVDSLIPIGKGQRELIIGDRKIGKTSIAIESIINQQYTLCEVCSGYSGTYCFYVAIGQKLSSLRRIIYRLRRKKALKYTTIIIASASDSAGSQYLAPYSGCTLAEWFRNKGKHSLVVYDDLGKQAIAYRQMSLLLTKPPGREAFPGDIFYVHSRLLERSAKLSKILGGGSLTALPIVETLQGDLASYIPTNLISITDGQIYLDADIFKKGIIPAVDFSLSVSRVGSKAQIPILKDLSKGFLSQIKKFRQLELFQSFGSDIDAETRHHLNRGARAVEMLKQRYLYFGIIEQVFMMFTTLDGFWDDISLNEVPIWKSWLLYVLRFKDSTLLQLETDLNYHPIHFWYTFIRCAILSKNFKLEKIKNKSWLSAFLKYLKLLLYKTLN